jgi:hypothetical protein
MPKIRAETARFPGKKAFQSPANSPNGLKQDMYVSGTPYACKYLEKRVSGCLLHFFCYQGPIDTKRSAGSTGPGRLAFDAGCLKGVVEQIWIIFLPDIYPPAAT